MQAAEAGDNDNRDTEFPHGNPDEPDMRIMGEDRKRGKFTRLMETPLRKYFEACIKYEASDLHLRGGQVAKLRLRGALKSLGNEPIPEDDFEKWVDWALSDKHYHDYVENGSADMAQHCDGTRFRVNLFRTKSQGAMAIRRVSNKILRFQDLLLPPSMEKVADQHQGLVLLCGVTGSGKSTTIASMLQFINETRAVHIVTIEDPIEYVFADAKSLVNQREIGIDCKDFAIGLRALMREDPDVVLIGEMRDRETFEAALQASETGHLVFGTIHASGATQAFSRIYDLFPAEEHQAIRNILAYQMQAFVYQKLLPTIREDIARVPAVEILLQSPPTRKFVIEGREIELDSVMKNNRNIGMQTLNDSLVDLVNREYIHPRTAEAASNNPEELKRRLRGIE